MPYRLFNKDGVEVTHHDLQDKSPWCRTGATKEEVFISKFGNKFGLKINPEKVDNKFAPDLINLNNNQYGDLKTQNTPFFKSQSKFNLDPQFTVVFNLKDRSRYAKLYPNIEIYFWVEWLITRFVWEKEGKTLQEILVQPTNGIWFITFQDLVQVLSNAPVHNYIQRKNDNRGNAQNSYIISLLDPRFKKILEL